MKNLIKKGKLSLPYDENGAYGCSSSCSYKFVLQKKEQ